MEKVLNEVPIISITKDTNNISKEVENMNVRKSETLKSLDELNLSARIKGYLKGHFGSIDEIVRQGRIVAFQQELGVQLNEEAKWRSELPPALKGAGFIRPATDFIMTFHINAIYRIRFREWENCFVTSIEQLSNKQYEDFRALSDEYVEDVKHSLQERLTDREYKLVFLRFGLDGNKARTFGAIADYFGITTERVRQIDIKALRKLRHPSAKLPAIFDAPSDIEKHAENLCVELEELYESPVFKQINAIEWELERMRKAPFRYACKYLKAGALDNTEIGELDLTVRTYNCLRRAGINTIGDIINFPKEDWSNIKYLGRTSLNEVVEKMYFVGYKDFNISPAI